MRASVVVPTYERPEKLDVALESLLDQTADDYEVVVVDDGSDSREQQTVLDRFENRERVEILRQANAGPAAARNRGWREASGDVVLFTDDDCIAPDDWVDSLVAGFEEGVAAVGGPLVPRTELLTSNVFARAHKFRDEMAYGVPRKSVRGREGLDVAGTANVAYRRSVLAEVDGFDESFPLAAGEDADLQTRVLDVGYEMVYVPVAVRHNDDYNWRSFVERAVRSGRGTYHFHRKHGESRAPWRVLAGLVGSGLYFPPALWRSRSPAVSGLYVAERALNRLGELSSTFADD